MMTSDERLCYVDGVLSSGTRITKDEWNAVVPEFGLDRVKTL